MLMTVCVGRLSGRMSLYSGDENKDRGNWVYNNGDAHDCP